MPKTLQEIIKDEKKRQKLVIYINPPYAESASATTATKKSDNKNKTNVSNTTRISEVWMKDMGKSIRELYVQFFVRIIKEIGGCVLATFSTLKYINASNFVAFRKIFKGDFLGGFITPSETFDNVKEGFPIGFLIWNTHSKKKIQDINLDVFNKQGTRIGSKFFYPSYDTETINQWIKKYAEYNTLYEISAMCCKGTDFQNSKYVNINFWNYLKGVGNAKGVTKFRLSKNNLIVSFVYFSVRHAIKATWINDRDQFYAPNPLWEEDREFQSDCFAFALFHGQNKISSQNGINYFIPFTEHEVGAKSAFESDFMTRFINGKVEFYNMNNSLYKNKSSKLEFSLQAKAVFNAGREIFIHYHVQASNTKSYNVNASLYDIKEFFQGRDNRSGDMNDIKQAKDTRYKELMAVLGETLGELAKKLEPKIYEYGFLKE
ncbi:hypothetical protein [Helicobacter brantae]|uniref:hypothetical protein n=1 Tax=Helicobacter brantae TaxID=375927 RepID=UPI0026975A14